MFCFVWICKNGVTLHIVGLPLTIGILVDICRNGKIGCDVEDKINILSIAYELIFKKKV